MKQVKKILLGTAMLVVATVSAQNSRILVDFDNVQADSLQVYDAWNASPFNKGELQGQLLVVDNPGKEEANKSNRVLRLQRSRFGSNVFGAKIRLKTPFVLTNQMQYIHVMMRRPTTGRMMLVGLGKRNERVLQSDQVPQFNSVSVPRNARENEWQDVVFPVIGFGGITVSSLVVVPDLSSPHHLEEDFLTYIDNIEISDSPMPRFDKTPYPINADYGTTHLRSDRALSRITMNGNQGSQNTITIPSNIQKNIYKYMDTSILKAKPGERFTPAFTYSGGWMHGYVYIDFGRDGKFDISVENNGRPSTNSDVVAYSYAGGKNSVGSIVGNQNPGVNPPAFVLPSNLIHGMYRIRYKVDWNSLDAGGNVSGDNHIVANAGAIVDAVLNVHGTETNVSISTRNGEVLRADSSQLADTTVPFGQPLEILMHPAPGFKQGGIVIKHGYNLRGDSLLYGTAQYRTHVIPTSAFVDNKVVIPAEYIDGDNIEITAEFAEVGLSSHSGKASNVSVSYDIDLQQVTCVGNLTAYKLATLYKLDEKKSKTTQVNRKRTSVWHKLVK